jgi:O-antigen/teichoic acid export membrane protein
MFFGAVNGSQTGALSGFESFNKIALGNLIRGSTTLLFVTAGAALGGLTGALVGYVAVGGATAIFYQIVIRRECAQRSVAISYRFGREDVAILWRFTFPVLLSTFSFTPAAWWSNVLLARRSGYAEAGIFNAISNWQMFILFFSSAISSIGLPMLSNIRAEQNPAKYKSCLRTNFLVIPAPAIAVAVPVMICSHFILRLYGPAFQHGARALMLMALAAVLTAVNIPVGHALWSLNATTSAMLLALLNGAVLVLGAYALTGHGAVGLAGAYVIMGLIQTAVNVPLMIWLLRRRFALNPCAEEMALV